MVPILAAILTRHLHVKDLKESSWPSWRVSFLQLEVIASCVYVYLFPKWCVIFFTFGVTFPESPVSFLLMSCSYLLHLGDVVFQAPFFSYVWNYVFMYPASFRRKKTQTEGLQASISHPETAQSKGLRHHGLGHKWKTIGQVIWNVELIVDLPGSLVLWLDLDSQKTEPSNFLKGRFQQQNRWMTFLSGATTPPKKYSKNPQGINLLDLRQDTIIIMGFIPAPKRTKGPLTCLILASAPWNHWTDPNENEYASSGSSSLKKKGGRNMTYVWKFVIAQLHLASFQASSANCGGSIMDGRNGNVDTNNASLLKTHCRPIMKLLNLHEFPEKQSKMCFFVDFWLVFLEGIIIFLRNLIIFENFQHLSFAHGSHPGHHTRHPTGRYGWYGWHGRPWSCNPDV